MADSYAPVYELNGTPTKVVASYVRNGLLDRWLEQSMLPVANNAMGKWLMGQVGYVPPSLRITPGREYP